MADSKQQQDGVAPFTEKEVASYPRPCTAIPSAISFSPDDASIGFLHSGGGASLSRQFYAFDVASQTTKQFVDAASVGGDMPPGDMPRVPTLRAPLTNRAVRAAAPRPQGPSVRCSTASRPCGRPWRTSASSGPPSPSPSAGLCSRPWGRAWGA